MIGAVQWDRTLVPLGVALVVGLAASVPAVARGAEKGLTWLRKPSGRVRAGIALGLFVISARYFLFTAEHAGRPLIPVFHDEYMYLLQARMLSVGRLWMPQHPMAEFFDSILVQVKPVYAAPYFPGTAMVYVPGIWLGLAPWATSVTIAGMVVALTYVVFSELLDGVMGLLAALLTVANETFRGIAVMTMSHTVLMLLLLVTYWGWSRWRGGTHRLGWAAVIGLAAGWALITRPLDAVCFLMPMGLGVAWEQVRARRRGAPGVAGSKSGVWPSVAVAALAALPFLAVQLVFDRGVTGHWLTSPVGTYARANLPGLDFGFHARVADAESSAPLPQVRDYFAQFFRDDLARHASRGFVRTWVMDRVWPVLRVGVPSEGGSEDPADPARLPLVLALAPIGLWALRRGDARHAALAAFPLLLSVAFAFYPSYLRHYGLTASAGVVVVVLLGLQAIEGRVGSRTRVGLVLGIAALCVASLPELSGRRDRFPTAPYLVDVEVKLSELEHTPALVMFKYEPGRTDVNEEPVYNLGAANVDDELIVRAQDRGADNVRLYKYYADLGQKRFVYVYDRGTAELRGLGWVEELAK